LDEANRIAQRLRLPPSPVLSHKGEGDCRRRCVPSTLPCALAPSHLASVIDRRQQRVAGVDLLDFVARRPIGVLDDLVH
jgi:hypothetical protein